MPSKKNAEQRTAELQTGDVKARKDAALWLGRKGVGEALFPLVAALQDKSWKVRRNAAVALGNLGEKDAVEPLLIALTDRTLSVKRAAVNALGALRDARATEGLAALTEDAHLGDDALKALIRLGAPALLYCSLQMQIQNHRYAPTITTVFTDKSDAEKTIEGVNPLWRQTRRQMILHGTNPVWRQTVHRMVLQGREPLLHEALCIEDWNGQQRWLVLETVRSVQSSLSLFELWRLPKFSRIADIPDWCERLLREPEHTALHPGAKQVLDYIMLGRASQRDYATESEELLRAAAGTHHRDTGMTLLRASEQGEDRLAKPTLLGRLRRWLRQERQQ